MAGTNPNNKKNGPLVNAKTAAEKAGAISSFTPPSYKIGNSSRFTLNVKETLSDINTTLTRILYKLRNNKILTKPEQMTLAKSHDLFFKYNSKIIELTPNNSKLLSNANNSIKSSVRGLLDEINKILKPKISTTGGRRKTRRSKKRSKKTRRRH